MTIERAIKIINVFLGDNDLCSCSGENCLHVSCKECRREAIQIIIEALKERRPLVKISKIENLEKLENIIKNSPMMFITSDTEKIELIREQQWIPCSERLPKTNGVYIVARWFGDGCEKRILSDACYFDGSDTWYDDTRLNHGREYVTHKIVAWMPLPEPYTE